MSDLTASVCEHLIEGILCGKFPPGSKLIAERDFAEKFSVSRITVRRAFARLEKAGIIIRKRPSGTYVADTFQAHCGELKSIGLITALPHEFSGSFVEAVSGCCENEDILLALGIPQDHTVQAQLRIAERMALRGVKNLIVWGAAKSSAMQFFERLRILGVNLVFFDQVIPGTYADYVGLDNQHAVSALAEAAVSRGKTHLIFLNYSGLEIDSNMEREAAFRQKVADSGEISGEVRYLPYKADAAEKRKFASELFRDVSANSAVIGVNAPLIQAVFHGEIRDVPVFCIDHVPKLHELNVTGFAQPIAEMADCAVQMLKNQCRKGKKWQCEHRRFKGVTVAP